VLWLSCETGTIMIVEQATATAHRGINMHLLDSHGRVENSSCPES
jgi:hypothetical protein